MKFKQWWQKYQLWCQPILVTLFFIGCWGLVDYWQATDKSVAVIENARIKNWFELYHGYFGLIAGLISMILNYWLLIGLKLIKKMERRWLVLTAMSWSFVPWLIIACQLLYWESSYADIAKGWLVYGAQPSQWAVIVTLVVIWCWWWLEDRSSQRAKELLKVITLAVVCLVVWRLSGLNLGWLTYQTCGYFDEISQDQCYQWAAVQTGKMDWCERISGVAFVGMPINPTRDKCYLQIAKNTGQLAACDQIRGGLMSYSREECLQAVAKKFADPKACEQLDDLEAVRCQMELMIAK